MKKLFNLVFRGKTVLEFFTFNSLDKKGRGFRVSGSSKVKRLPFLIHKIFERSKKNYGKGILTPTGAE